MPSKNHEYDDLPIDALPMLLYAIEGALDAAKDQLMNMQKAKDKPHVLDDEIISQISSHIPSKIIQSQVKEPRALNGKKVNCLQSKKYQLSSY